MYRHLFVVVVSVTPVIDVFLENEIVAFPESASPALLATCSKQMPMLLDPLSVDDGKSIVVALGSASRTSGNGPSGATVPTVSSVAPVEGTVSEKVTLSNSNPLP